MTHPRPSASALIGVLLATFTFAAPATPVVASTPSPSVCSPGEGPTLWTDQDHPPTTIRVLRSKGPSAGQVQTVNFWKYVGTVLRVEYSTGLDTPPGWMRMGALAVKQYGWYYALHWRGGYISLTTANPDGTTTTTVACYDVKDTTADQLYKPEETWPDGTIFKGATPSPANLRAMRETWNLSLRKWMKKKGKSKLFLTSYRAGTKVPCGSDATGTKVMQKSLRDCLAKELTFGEVLREYFEPMYVVDSRTNDVLTGDGSWAGDLGVLAPTSNNQTQWRLYPGRSESATFGRPTAGTFGTSFSAVVGYGTGNVDAVDEQGANDERLLADLMMLTANGKLLVAHANGSGYDSPTATTLGSAADRLVVGDFDGDLLSDAGLLRSNGDGTSTLSVMYSRGDGSFSAATQRWTGSFDVAASDVFVAAGDVNGDGKADLIIRDTTGAYSTADSPATCYDLSTWGTCPAHAAAAPTLQAATAAADPGWAAANVKNAVGDYDRDGRDDVLAVVKDGTGVKVFGLRSRGDGTFADRLLLFASGSIPFANAIPAAINVNTDGIVDLAFVSENGSSSRTWCGCAPPRGARARPRHVGGKRLFGLEPDLEQQPRPLLSDPLRQPRAPGSLVVADRQPLPLRPAAAGADAGRRAAAP